MAKASNFIVTSLPEYVNNNRDVLIKNFGLVGGTTRQRIGVQTGIKSKDYINYLEVSPTLQDGSQCELEPAGDVTLTQREIETAWIEVLISICPKKLIGKWAEYLIRANANESSLPFEQYIMDGFEAEVNKKIEKLIWQGDKTKTTDSNLKWIDGFVKEFTEVGKPVTVTGETTLAKLQSFAKGFDADETLHDKGAVIYVAPAVYRAFLADMVEKNLYHYAGAESGQYPAEFFLPGSDVKVVPIPGLAGVDTFFASFDDNLRYGCDMENDEEDVKVIYDDIKELFYVKALWNSGVQVAYPDFCYYSKVGE